MATYHQLITALSAHIGRERGITARHLCARLNVPERQVRTLVSEARENGYGICGTPRDGYYIAANAEELEETCQFLRHRAMHSLTLESRLRKVSLVDLVGQLRLPT
ncbi:MAG: hypothetical protein PHQ05_10245 [Sterolibacterium sp.]|nr:hypothetical protein [Sterolibacterium sp.]